MNIYLYHGWPDIIALAGVGATAYYCVLIQNLRVHRLSELLPLLHTCTNT